MERRPSSAPPVRKRPAGPRPARATPSQPSLSPVDAYEHLDLSLRKSPSANSEMNLRSSASASGAVVQRAETGLGNASTNRAVKMMDELRALGYWPRAASGYEYSLRKQICRHIEDGVFSMPQTAELEAMKKTMQADVGRKIMEKIRALGYTPKRKSEHDHLAQTYQTAVKLGKISPLQKQEAEALTAAHQASPAQRLDPPPEVRQPLDPLDASTATTLQKRPAAACTQKDSRSLTEAISSLGRWPKRKMEPKGDAEIAENNLAIRLYKAQKKGIGEGTELASVLDNLPPDIRPNVADKVMDEIRALGYVPKRTKKPVGEAQIAENSLARKLSRLCRNAETSQTHDASQLGSNTDTLQTDDASQVVT